MTTTAPSTEIGAQAASSVSETAFVRERMWTFARLGGDGGVERAALRRRTLELRELPRRALRPREHGAGGLEHDAGPSARDHAVRDRRADGAPRRPCRSVPRAPRATVGDLAVAARARRSRRSWSSRSARCRSSGSGVVTSAPSAAALLALGYLAYPWTATSAAASIHPVTLRDPAPPLLHLVPRLRPARPVRPCARFSRCRPASSWGFRSPRSASGTRLRAGGVGRGRRDRRARRGVDRSSRSTWSSREFSGGASMFYGFYDAGRRLAGRCRADALHAPGRDPLAR